MAPEISQLRDLILRVLEARDHTTLSQRQAVYGQLRSAYRQALHQSGIESEKASERLHSFDSIVADIEASIRQKQESAFRTSNNGEVGRAEIDAIIAARWIPRRWLFLALTLAMTTLVLCAWTVSQGIEKPDIIASRYEGARAQFFMNMGQLTAIRKQLEDVKSELGSYPTSNREFVSWRTVRSSNLAQFSEMPAQPHLAIGDYLYVSDGQEYKILAAMTQDCFVARLERNELVDKIRNPGKNDCLYYGFWSAGGEGL